MNITKDFSTYFWWTNYTETGKQDAPYPCVKYGKLTIGNILTINYFNCNNLTSFSSK